MPLILAALWSLAGFSACFAAGSALAALSGRRDKAQAAFAAISCAFLAYVVLQIGVLASNDLARTAGLLRLQGLAMAFLFASLPWFSAAFSGRKSDWFDQVVGVIYVALGVWSLASHSGYWFSSLDAIDPISVGGGTIHQPRGTLAPTYFVSIALQYPLYGRFILDAFRLRRSGARLDAWIWGCSTSVLLLAATHDHAVDFGALPGPYYGEYVFPLFVLTIAARMTARRNAEYTELVRLQASLAASEARFRDLFESAGDALFIHDINSGAILDVNRTMTEMYGWSRDECLRMGVADLSAAMPEYSAEAARARIGIAVRDGATTFEWMAKRRDGSVFPVEVELKRIAIAGQTAVLADVRDITERRRLEERLHQAQRLEAIGQLAGGVAHDFNNLLTPILGYSEILLQGLPPDDAKRLDLEQIHSAAEKARNVTNQLLTFGRRTVLKVRTVEVNTLVSGMTKILRTLLREDISLAFTLDPRAGAVEADAAAVEQVVMNLIVNARDALPKGGTIALATKPLHLDDKGCAANPGCRPGWHVVLSVSDTGTGMSPEVQSRIFEPFYTTKETGKGTGLGLATVFAIVQLHGGTVVVESQTGKGSTFRVVLPASSRIPGVEDVAQAKPSALGHETILVVEDNEAVREFACRVLGQRGYQAIAAASPEEARRRSRELADIHLVLSDVVLPNLNGRELCEELCRDRPGLKVLYMSGYTGDTVSEHGVLDPGINLVQKPFTAHALLARVREVLDVGRV